MNCSRGLPRLSAGFARLGAFQEWSGEYAGTPPDCSSLTLCLLKIAQEAIALTVFGLFMVFVLGEALSWRHLAAFGCIMAAVGFLFIGR